MRQFIALFICRAGTVAAIVIETVSLRGKFGCPALMTPESFLLLTIPNTEKVLEPYICVLYIL